MRSFLAGEAGGGGLDERRWSRATFAVDAAAIAAGLGVQRAFSQRANERLPRAGARNAGWVVAATGVGGVLIGGLQEALDRSRSGHRFSQFVVVPAAAGLAIGGELFRRWRARSDGEQNSTEDEISISKALAMSLAVVGVTTTLSAGERKLADRIAWAASRVLPGNEALWRPLGHAVSLAALTAGTRFAIERGFGTIEKREESVEPSFDIPPLSSGLSGSLDSDVSFASLSKQGRRFVWNAQAAEMISEVMGEDAIEVVRVYVGLESAKTEAERVALAIRELERTGAFDREWLLVDLPTGTGYVNYAAVSALEMLARGNSATVAMQYAARPSPLSLDRVGEGRKQARLLLDAISERSAATSHASSAPRWCCSARASARGPARTRSWGKGRTALSTAASTTRSGSARRTSAGGRNRCVRDDRTDVKAELIGIFNDIGEWEATPTEQRDGIRYVMITHHNDGVARFGPGIIIQAPEWLGKPDTRWEQIPKGMRWVPNTTFFQVLVDMKNSANVVPGVFAATGHDYRADLLPFFRAVLGIEASDEQMQRVAQWLEDREFARSEWAKRHGTADTSLAASLVASWIREDPARATRMVLDRVPRDVDRGLRRGGKVRERRAGRASRTRRPKARSSGEKLRVHDPRQARLLPASAFGTCAVSRSLPFGSCLHRFVA